MSVQELSYTEVLDKVNDVRPIEIRPSRFNIRTATKTGISLKVHSKPYFYSDDDVKKFKKIIGLISPHIKISSNPFTFIPNFSLQLEEGLGMERLDLCLNFLRPNINNVRSCHCYSMSDTNLINFSRTNLSYISDPNWSTVAFYSTKGAGTFGVRPVTEVRELVGSIKNYVATANIMLGEVYGVRCLFVSRPYGSKMHVLKALKRLVQVSFGLDTPICLGGHYSCTGLKFIPPGRRPFRIKSHPIQRQLVMKGGSVLRFPDIPSPYLLGTKIGEDQVVSIVDPTSYLSEIDYYSLEATSLRSAINDIQTRHKEVLTNPEKLLQWSSPEVVKFWKDPKKLKTLSNGE